MEHGQRPSSLSIPIPQSARGGPLQSDHDGFLCWDFDLEPSQPLLQTTSQQDCPSCGNPVDLVSTSLHAHLTQCFLQNQLSPGSLEDLQSSMEHVQSVQKCIAKMDLRTRLGMMESFYRLSKSQESGEMSLSPVNSAVSPKAHAHDSTVLSLLYGRSASSFSAPPTAMPSRTGVDFDMLRSHGEDSDMLIMGFGDAQPAFSFMDSTPSVSIGGHQPLFQMSRGISPVRSQFPPNGQRGGDRTNFM